MGENDIDSYWVNSIREAGEERKSNERKADEGSESGKGEAKAQTGKASENAGGKNEGWVDRRNTLACHHVKYYSRSGTLGNPYKDPYRARPRRIKEMKGAVFRKSRPPKSSKHRHRYLGTWRQTLNFSPPKILAERLDILIRGFKNDTRFQFHTVELAIYLHLRSMLNDIISSL